MDSVQCNIIEIVKETIKGIEVPNFPMRLVVGRLHYGYVGFFIRTKLNGTDLCLLEGRVGTVGTGYEVQYGLRYLIHHRSVDLIDDKIFGVYDDNELIPGDFFYKTKQTLWGSINEDASDVIRNLIVEQYNYVVMLGSRFNKLNDFMKPYKYRNSGLLELSNTSRGNSVIIRQGCKKYDEIRISIKIGNNSKDFIKPYTWVGSDDSVQFMERLCALQGRYDEAEKDRQRVMKDLRRRINSFCSEELYSLDNCG